MKERGVRKKLTGVVVSSKMDKTAVVLVDRLKKHSTYSKYIRRHSKYLAHDPKNMCQPGDRIRIIESRPISKSKRWQVIEIIERGEAVKIEGSDDQSLEQEK
jgi:small subunit ribosomal protein S17